MGGTFCRRYVGNFISRVLLLEWPFDGQALDGLLRQAGVPVFLFPFKPVIFVVKGVLKGAARLGKGIYKHIKGNPSSTSVHQTEAFLDDPLELQKVLDEASVS
ncbi:unnamed protein product [Durusdinium trenchii]|uniref:Uncharacterized protein n=2 Tax=Durusdinium trenchii TaxID=1381693 RepID=A0ABP0QED1_9DINO